MLTLRRKLCIYSIKIAGTAILCLLGILLTLMLVATGSVLDKTTGTIMVQLVNIFNLFFLLIVNSLIAVLLINRCLPTVDPARISIDELWISIVLEIIGLMHYVMGYLLVAWAFFCVFSIYVVLLLLLIPMEEDGLKKAFGDQYRAYQQKTKKLVPFIYSSLQ